MSEHLSQKVANLESHKNKEKKLQNNESVKKDFVIVITCAYIYTKFNNKLYYWITNLKCCNNNLNA